MRAGFEFRVLFAFTLTLSFLGSPLVFPLNSPIIIPLARGNVMANQNWYPAGPSMDSLFFPIFVDQGTEWLNFPSQFDFPDVPLTPTQISQLQTNYPITMTSSDGTVSGLEFNFANNYWGCLFSYAGTSDLTGCGVQIRMGIAHLIDRGAFAVNDRNVQAMAVDNPTGQGLTPDPCAWDTLFPQTGTGCQVNGVGGTSYHLATASPCGTSSCPSTPPFPSWTSGMGTPDFCAAADHFIKAGIASGASATVGTINGVPNLHLPGTGTCQLTGISPSATANPVKIFVRVDNGALADLGYSIAQGLCALFTGSFSTGCTIPSIGGQPVVIKDIGNSNNFTGFTTIPGKTNLGWWIYTFGGGSYSPPGPLTDEHLGPVVGNFPEHLVEHIYALYTEFSRSAANLVPGSTCTSNLSSSSSYTPANYGYLCDPTFDAVSSQIASAPCVSAPGDPTTGQTGLTVTFANCPNTTQLTAASADYKAEDYFGQNAYAIPVFIYLNQFVYPSSWSSTSGGRVINSWGGTFGYFNWLNAYSSTPGLAGTIRQALSQSPTTINPYAATSPWDFAILGAIYDSLAVSIPSLQNDTINWMAFNIQLLPNSGLSYAPPTGTVGTYRYTLRNDLFWQDGKKVTSWDAKFSYVTLKTSGSLFGAAPLFIACTDQTTCVDAVTVLSPTQFDIHVSQLNPATLQILSTMPILPGAYWTACTSTQWNSGALNPTFSPSNIPDNCMKVGVTSSTYSKCPTTSKTLACFDPLSIGSLVGSGPWICKSPSTNPGGGCSSNGTENPGAGGGITLTRYGQGTAPGGSLNTYFRSSGNAALWAWSGDRGDFGQDFLNFGVASLCFGKPVGTTGCTVWQHGMGGSAAGTPVGLAQISIIQRFVGVNWVAPYTWTAPPANSNIVPFPPVLYEGAVTLNPCNIDPVNGYDC